MVMNTEKTETTVALRVPQALRQFYQGIADKERRTLSQVLRRALEEYKAKALKKAA